VAEREIVSIIWHQRGDQVDLVYIEGESDRLVGAHDVVAELARSVGLISVPSASGTIRWVRPTDEGTT